MNKMQEIEEILNNSVALEEYLRFEKCPFCGGKNLHLFTPFTHIGCKDCRRFICEC